MRPGRCRHDENAVGEEHRLAQIVGHEDDGDAARGMKVADHAPQLLAGEGVERAERLIEHQQAAVRGSARGRATRAAACRRTAPRDTCRQSRRGPTDARSFSARSTYFALLRRISLRCGSTISSGSRRFSSVVRQGSSVGAWNAMPAILTGWRIRDAATCTDPFKGKLQPGHELHQGGLAAARGADHGRELTGPDRDRQPFDRERAVAAGTPSVGVADPIESDKRRHSQKAPETCQRSVRLAIRRSQNEASTT